MNKLPHKKSRGPRGYGNRPYNTKKPKDLFLIVCEGETTEPNYFRSFPLPRRLDIKEFKVVGLGMNTLDLVKQTIEQKKQKKRDDRYDQVWCVFDRDSFPTQNFKAAFELAAANGIKIAYSNEAFELWYLLHFHFYNTGVQRSDYVKRLKSLLGYEYLKNSTTIYSELLSKQQTAIKHAENLLAGYMPQRPESDNPSTTVHLLVQELNKFIR